MSSKYLSRSRFLTLFLVITYCLIASISDSGSRAQQKTAKKGLVFRLSEGREEATPKPERPPAPVVQNLTAEATDEILKRLPAIKSEDGDEAEFALRDRSLPPPKTGRVINEEFPAPGSAAPNVAPSGSLQILRFAPEGDVALAPNLSVTFSEPMVALTSQSELIEATPPVALSPRPKGRWRWIGTRTLLFEPDGRFPMATRYAVEIRAGTKSITGNSLERGHSWKFATPALKIVKSYPEGESQPRDPLCFIEFNQEIDPEKLLPFLAIRTTAGERRVRRATQTEISQNEELENLIASAEEGRWIAFKKDAANPLPGEVKVDIVVKSGAPSAEGALVTTEAQQYSFDTYGDLKFVKKECQYDGVCRPGAEWELEFSNLLEDAGFDKSLIKVQPPLPGMEAIVLSNTIRISGDSRPNTKYSVAVSPLLKDRFGQKLGRPVVTVFNVEKSEPILFSQGGNLAVLDPNGPKSYSVYSVNHSSFTYKLYAVGPEDWAKFGGYIKSQYRQSNDHVSPPGRLVKQRKIETGSAPDKMIETRIDLSPALKNGLGHAVLLVEPENIEQWRNSIHVWIQSTSIGLSAFADQSQMLVWANSLKDGKPLSSVSVELRNTGEIDKPESESLTLSNGLARLPLSDREGGRMLLARLGDDTAIMNESASFLYPASSQWRKKPQADSLSWHLYDDRGMYRPGEDVHVKGWVRRLTPGPAGDVALPDRAINQIAYEVIDSRSNKIHTGNVTVNAWGGFDLAFKLPQTMNLGGAALLIKRSGNHAEAYHRFQVQEFRRPEYEVKAAASAAPHFIKESAVITASANYYAGGALPNADVKWVVNATPTNYTPPNRGDFTFGKWIPWWRETSSYEDGMIEEFNGKTDSSGNHRLRLDFISANPARPYSVQAEASVADVNRQTWSAGSTLLLHPASLYVGLKTDRAFVGKGEPIIVKSIVTDLDGKAIAKREIRMRAVRLAWTYRQGKWVEEEKESRECVVRSAADAVECKFDTSIGGTHRIIATVIDDRERMNQTEIEICVAGGEMPPSAEVEEEKLNLIPDRKDYAAGDLAEILVQAPFYPAEGLLTLQRSGLVSEERFTVTGPSHVLKIPIVESYVPNLHVQVDLVGARARTDQAGKPAGNLPKRPAFAKGELNMSIPPASRKLALTATPKDAAAEPGAETSVDVQVRDASGAPVQGGEVALIVVDESVLALTAYKLIDPIELFYQGRSSDVFSNHSREGVILAQPVHLSEIQRGGGAGGGHSAGVANQMISIPPAPPLPKPSPGDARAFDFSMKGAEMPAINTRINFNALATFAASLPTDSQGRATVKFKLPDNLTRYRVMAVAAAGENKFGTAESAITARLPLMVRPSAPRFLNFGDRFELPVVVQNQTDQPMQVDIAARAYNAQFTSGAGRRVTVPANDRVEVRLPSAAVKPGAARFQFAAVSGKWSDSAEISLPVWTPATTEAFATYGEIDSGAIVQSIKAPSDAIPQFGGLELTTSSTQLQSLTDAVIYLTNYPFECAEQISSRILAIAALRDALAAFDAKGLPKPEELKAFVTRDLKRLEGMQNDDGGFGFWRQGDLSWPFLSVHAAHAMARAKEKGFDASPDMIERSKRYLREIDTKFPSNYSLEARRVLTAYALYTRNRLGERDAAAARSLIFSGGGADKLPIEALGWLLPVLSGDPRSSNEVNAIKRHLANRAEETAGAAHFTTNYSDGAYLLLHSSRRADGIILESLIGDDPKSDLIPKLVRGLLAHRKQGRWENTQENAFVLLALDRYFDAYEKEAPNFAARAWLGEAFAGSREFRSRTTDSYQLNVPMKYLLSQAGAQQFVLSKEGSGRLYYRLGMQYAPADLRIKPADYGFTVSRSYEAIDDRNDVRREEDGTWRIRAGAQVRVRLTMFAPARRYHVALVDYLPAGFEALNPALAVTGRLPDDPKEKSWFSWFEHQNLRDERVEAFTSLLWEGVYNYSYVAKAATPGIFAAPPAKAEEMYHPETFGRGATDRVVIE